MKNTIERIEEDVKNSLHSYFEFAKNEKVNLNERDVEMYKRGVDFTLKRVKEILEKL